MERVIVKLSEEHDGTGRGMIGVFNRSVGLPTDDIYNWDILHKYKRIAPITWNHLRAATKGEEAKIIGYVL